VEIPPGADLAWEVDVRKSTVRPPAALTGRIIALAESARTRSVKVFTHRGAPVSHQAPRTVQPVWQQVRRLGRSAYVINRDHPLIAEVLEKQEGEAVEGLLCLIESTLPVRFIAQEATLGGSGEQLHGQAPPLEEVLSKFRAMLAGFPRGSRKREKLAEELVRAEPFCHYPGLIREAIDSDSEEL